MKEAMWTLCNACAVANPHQIWRVVDMKGMEAIVKMLEVADVKLKVTMLKTLHTIIACGESEEEGNKLAEYLDSLGGLSKVCQLQHDKNNEVYNCAVEILVDFFNVEECDKQ